MTDIQASNIDCKRQSGKWVCNIDNRGKQEFSKVKINSATRMETIRRGFRASYRAPAKCDASNGRLKCDKSN